MNAELQVNPITPEPLYVLKPSSDHYRTALDSEVQRRALDAELAAWLLAEKDWELNWTQADRLDAIATGQWLVAEREWRYKIIQEDDEDEIENLSHLLSVGAWLLAEAEWKRRVDARNANLTAEESYNKGYGTGFGDGFNIGVGDGWR